MSEWVLLLLLFTRNHKQEDEIYENNKKQKRNTNITKINMNENTKTHQPTKNQSKRENQQLVILLVQYWVNEYIWYMIDLPQWTPS